MIHISLASERVFEFGGFPITNTLMMSWIAGTLLVILGYSASRRMRALPGKLQNCVEAIIENMFSFVEQVVGSRAQARKVFPIVATIFLYVLCANWLGVFPGVGTVGFREIRDGKETFAPILRSAYSDMNMTLALALIAVVSTHVFGIAAKGIARHAGTYISLAGPVDFFVGILEFFSEIAKVISFSFRLFGNIFAGEVLLVVIAALVPFLAPVPFLGLELFVGFVQALIFATLTLVFFHIATVEH